MKKKILIVEDEKALSKALKDTLARNGFDVTTARNGEEGLSIALAEHPDLILLDILMPKMDGITTLKKLREDSWGEKANVVILTNNDEADNIAEAMKERTFDYYIKSDHSLDEIVKKLKIKLGIK